MWPESAGDEVGHLAEGVMKTSAIIPLMHPCLVLQTRRAYRQVVVRSGGKSKDWVSEHAISGVQMRKKSGATDGPHMCNFLCRSKSFSSIDLTSATVIHNKWTCSVSLRCVLTWRYSVKQVGNT